MASTQSDKSEMDEETPSEEEEAAAESDEERADGTEDGSDSEDESEDGAESDDDSESEDDPDTGSDDDTDASEAGSDETDAEDERAAAGASSTGKAKSRDGKARTNKKDGLTAGARLAAAKAAKAARKAAKRGKEKKDADPIAQVRDSQLAKKAQEAGSWAAQNRSAVIAALVAILLGIGGWAGWSAYSGQQAEAAGALLADAVEIAQAEIVAAEEGDDAAADDEPDADAAPTFPTEEARAEAALEAYRRVLTQYPSSDAAIWARLGEAKALSDLGRHADARQAYEAAEAEGGGDPSVALRALEGIAFTFESEEQWDEALQVYERLATLDDRRYQPVAAYHRARMLIAKGERERATETLRELVEDLGEAQDDAERQDFTYVLAQAETRLRELDPSAAPPPRAIPSDGPGGQMSNEQLQELIRQFQQKQQREQQGGGAE